MRRDAVVQPAPHVAAKLVGEELVLLDYEREFYYGLDPVGARIWELLATGRSIGELIEVLAGEYDVARDELAADVETLLQDLERNGLVKVVTDDVR